MRARPRPRTRCRTRDRHDGVRIVLGAEDTVPTDAGSLAIGGIGVERTLPGLVVRNGMLDPYDDHADLLGLVRYSNSVSNTVVLSRVPRSVKPPELRIARRTEQARATRVAVLDAARDLFVERGFVASTIQAIGIGRASRRDRLRDVPEQRRYCPRWWTSRSPRRRARAAPTACVGPEDARRARPAAPVRSSRGTDRSSSTHRSDLRGVARRRRFRSADRQAGGAILVATLRRPARTGPDPGRRGALRIGLSIDIAANVFFTIGSPQTFPLLTVDRVGPGKFEHWYTETMSSFLLGGR